MSEPHSTRDSYGRIRISHLGELATLVVLVVIGLTVLGVSLVHALGAQSLRATLIGLLVLFAVVLAAGFVLAAAASWWWQGEPWADLVEPGRGGEGVTVTTRDGVALHAEVDGPDASTPTVILCHDLTQNLTTWRHQRAALVESGVRVVAFDQRGHGLSTRAFIGARKPGVHQLAEDLADVVRVTAPDGPVVLVGHGIGAMAVMAVPATDPELYDERVTGVVLCAASAGPMRNAVSFGMPGLNGALRRYAPAAMWALGALPVPVQRLFGIAPWLFGAARTAGHRGAPKPVIREVAAKAYESDLRVAATFLAALIDHDEQSGLKTLSTKQVSIAVPGEDRFVPTATQVGLRSTVPGARLARLAGCGHVAPLERPDQITDLIRSVLARSASPLADVGLADMGLLGSTPTDLLQAATTDGLLSSTTDPGPNIMRKGWRPGGS